MDKSQSPLSKSGTPSPSHREALTPGAPGPSTSCLRLVSKAASGADPLGEDEQRKAVLSCPPPSPPPLYFRSFIPSFLFLFPPQLSAAPCLCPPVRTRLILAWCRTQG